MGLRRRVGGIKMKLGDKVFYQSDEEYYGVILEIKETLCRVFWFKNKVTEWVPKYSLIVSEN